MPTIQRLLAASVLTLSALGAVVLLFSDKAGVLYGDLVHLVIATGRGFERWTHLDLVDRSDIPGRADQIGHLLFWATVMVVVSLITRARVPLLVTSAAVAVTSLVSEGLQPLLSTHRHAEQGDAVANILGVIAATAAVATILEAHERFTRSRLARVENS